MFLFFFQSELRNLPGTVNAVKKIFFCSYISECGFVCISTALGAQKRSADPRAGVGGSYDPLWVSRRAVNTLNHSVIFLAPNFLKIHKPAAI